ncbi:APC family permease [Streptomyces sp. NPDC001118]
MGLTDAAGRGFQPTPTPRLPVTERVTLLLVLRAFASGSTAMTGIEAISNAVPAFRPKEWRNARTTLTWMVTLLIILFGSTIALVHLDGVVPHGNETVLSQLARHTFGPGVMYGYVQVATAAILLPAANTAFNDFPRVLFLLARSGHAPRMFLRVGDRLAFSNGIIVLAPAAIAVFAGFAGNTQSLIPLYAVGVFLAFTLSRAGMVVHWLHHRDQAHWRKSLVVNATGGLLSAIVFITAGITKFTEGAWVAVLVTGVFVLLLLRIHRHYDLCAKALALHPHAIELPKRSTAGSGRRVRPTATPPAAADTQAEEGESEESPEEVSHLVIVPIARLDLAGMRALAYAASLGQPVLALHLSPTENEAERFRGYWATWATTSRLRSSSHPHRAIVAPLVHYIESLHHQRPDLTLTVILPEIVVRHWWQRMLHNLTAPRLRRALRPLPKIVITTIPFHLPRWTSCHKCQQMNRQLTVQESPARVPPRHLQRQARTDHAGVPEGAGLDVALEQLRALSADQREHDVPRGHGPLDEDATLPGPLQLPRRCPGRGPAPVA